MIVLYKSFVKSFILSISKLTECRWNLIIPSRRCINNVSHCHFPVLCSSDSASPSKRTSVSSFQSAVDSDSAASINLNVEQDNVNFHIKKQAKYPHVPPHPAEQKSMEHPDPFAPDPDFQAPSEKRLRGLLALCVCLLLLQKQS